MQHDEYPLSESNQIQGPKIKRISEILPAISYLSENALRRKDHLIPFHAGSGYRTLYDRHDALPQQSFCLCLALKRIIDVDQMIGKLVKALVHQPIKNVQVMYAIEDEGLVLLEILNVLHEYTRNFSVMQSWIVVMDSMVPIVPAILIVDIVDAVEGTTEVSFRIILIDKAMLCPVAHHHDKPCIEHRDDKDHECRLEIDETHQHTKHDEGKFAQGKAHVNLLLLSVKKIHERIYDSHQYKPKQVFHEIGRTVPPIFQRATRIILLVVFDMVHDDVMRKIGLRSISKKRCYNPCRILVQPHISLLEHRAMAHTMKHEAKATLKVGLGDVRIGDEGQPPINALQQRGIHHDNPGKQNEVNPRQQMNERKISFIIDEPEPESFVCSITFSWLILGICDRA
jgi:hypothetical protein